MCICENISSAKCCAVTVAEAYVKAWSLGVNTEAMFNELMQVNNYIEALCNYSCECEKENDQKIINKKVLPDCEKRISLKNCLTENEVCNILEQIRLQCDSCECGC